jgi:hypothetical protein
MVRALLMRGMGIGLLAGVLAAAFAKLTGEAEIGRAIGFETAQLHDAVGSPEPAVVSRTIQSTVGLAVAVGLYGAAIGGLFGLAVAVGAGRLGRLRARALAGLVALGGFVSMVLVPWLKYPANPPSVGSPETLDERTGQYLSFVLLSVVLAVLAVKIGRELEPALGSWNAALVGGACYLAGVVIAALLLPEGAAAPDGFPAEVLWRFRLSALGTQAVLWGALGLIFGAVTERRLRSGAREVQAR